MHNRSKDTVDLIMSAVEIRAAGRALGEVTGGFRVSSFELRIGASEEEARALREKVRLFDTFSLDDDPDATVVVSAFTMRDLVIIRNAQLQTLAELGTWEYFTRTGIRFEEGTALLNRLAQITGDESRR